MFKDTPPDSESDGELELKTPDELRREKADSLADFTQSLLALEAQERLRFFTADLKIALRNKKPFDAPIYVKPKAEQLADQELQYIKLE